jgi:hypothetical protein
MTESLEEIDYQLKASLVILNHQDMSHDNAPLVRGQEAGDE